MIRNKFWLMIAAASSASPRAAQADVKPHPLFTTHVLQQGIKVPCGHGDDGEKVTVTLQGQEQATTAKTANGWFASTILSRRPYEMTIAGNNKVELKNVLVGEVWLQRQSNMEWSVGASTDARKTSRLTQPAASPLTVPHTGAEKPRTSVKGEWKECSPTRAASRGRLFLGRDVQKHATSGRLIQPRGEARREA